jgi:limonene-1,2-epoxide hydrolase
LDKTIPVRNLINAWVKLDLESLLAQLAEDAVFENIPMEPIVGKPAIRRALAAFVVNCTASPWELKNIAVSARGTVLTERNDIFVLRDGRRVNCPVMGAFDVNEQGLITHWRDYFDLGDWNRMMKMDPDFGRRRSS